MLSNLASTPEAPAEARPMMMPTAEGAATPPPASSAAPTFQYLPAAKGTQQQQQLVLQLDCLVYAEEGQTLEGGPGGGGFGAEALTPALLRQLRTFRAAMQAQGKVLPVSVENCGGGGGLRVAPLHLRTSSHLGALQPVVASLREKQQQCPFPPRFSSLYSPPSPADYSPPFPPSRTGPSRHGSVLAAEAGGGGK